MTEMSTNKNLDMLICIVPKINPDAPTVGPAILKAHLMEAGFTCEVLDLNIKLFNALKARGTHEKYYFENDQLFSTTYDFTTLNDDFNNFYDEYEYVFAEWIEVFERKNPTWIGLSILSVFSHSVAIKLSQLIREHLPGVKIVWGGPQVEKGIDTFKAKGLMDHYVCGDAEFSIVDLVQGNVTAKGIDVVKPNQIDLNRVLLPNYDDINWDEYHEYHRMWLPKAVYITGSRGCVKRCTFCTVASMWPEYRFRSGKAIASEIMMLRKKYDRRDFKFTDSLINGSMKAFRELLHELVEYRKTDDNFTWLSQWIIRSKNQSPEEDYRLMKQSGCLDLEIGMESFSERLRFEIGKTFTDEDMWWCLSMLQKYKIHCTLLMFVGYPTETEEDHKATLDMINKLFDLGYMHSKNEQEQNLIHLSFSNIMMLEDNMPVWHQIKDDLTYYEDMKVWEYKGNDLFTRLRRFKEVHELIQQRNFGKSGGWMYKKALRMYGEALEKREGRK